MPGRRVNLRRRRGALNGHQIEHHAVAVEGLEPQRVSVDTDSDAMRDAPILRRRRVPLDQWIKLSAAATAHNHMNAVHGREALESVVVTVQDELDAVFSINV